MYNIKLLYNFSFNGYWKSFFLQFSIFFIALANIYKKQYIYICISKCVHNVAQNIYKKRIFIAIVYAYFFTYRDNKKVKKIISEFTIISR